MTNVTVVHDTDIGTGLEISGGKVNVAATMATDAELAAAIAAADAAENMAEAQTKLRTDYVMRAHQHLTTAALIQVDGSKVRILPDASNSTTSSRILLMGGGKGGHAGASGYFDLTLPSAGGTITGLGIADITVDVNGFIAFPTHGSLYAKIPTAGAGASTPTEWYMAGYAGGYTVPEDYVLIIQHTSNIAPGNMFQLYDGTKLFQGYNYTDTGWIDMSPYFAAGVSVFGGGYQTPRFRRLNNRVYVEGMVSLNTTTPKLLATLPAGFIPALAHIYSTEQSGYTPVRVDVQPSGGIVQVTGSTHTWVSLAGINFGLD